MSKVRHHCILLCCCMLTSAFSHAQTRATVPAPKQEVTELTGRTFAVLIGVSKYKNLPGLLYAADDAIAFKNFLQSPGGGGVPAQNILLFTDTAVKTGVLRSTAIEWLNQKHIARGDRVFFYLAGHGDAYLDDYFFFTSDAELATGPRNYDIDGNIDLQQLEKRLQQYVKINQAEVYLIIDACRTNATTTTDSTTRMAMRLSQLAKSRVDLRGFYTFLSTRDGSVAFESPLVGGGHGVFTYYLLRGAIGEADAGMMGNNDGVVSLLELGTYLKSIVPKVTKELLHANQMPQYCCQDDDERKVFTVNSMFRQTVADDQSLIRFMQRNDNQVNVTLAGRSGVPADREMLPVYNEFRDALRRKELIGGNRSAAAVFDKMNRRWPANDLVNQAKLDLVAELINFPKDVIHLYLLGVDTKLINAKAKSAADPLEQQSFEYFQRVSITNFTSAAQHLQTAIELLGTGNAVAHDLFPVLWFLQARSFFDGNKSINLEQAISLSEQALRATPDAPHLCHLLAMLYIRKGNYAVAEKYFVKALNGETNYNRKSLQLGYELFRVQQYDEASVFYRIRNVSDEEIAIGYNTVALQYVAKREYTEAETFFLKALAADRKATFIKNNLAVLYHQQAMSAAAAKKNLEAEYYFKQALRTKPAFSQALINMGNFYQSLKQFESARNCYGEALTIDANDLLTLSNLATLYYNTRHYDSAISVSKLILSKSKAGSAAYQNAQVRINNSEKLLAKFQSKELIKNMAEPSLGIDTMAAPAVVAGRYLQVRDYASAFNFLKRHGTAKPDFNTELLSTEALIGLDRIPDALKTLEASEQLASTSSDLLQVAGKYVALNHNDPALRLLRSAVQRDQYSNDATFQLGNLLRQEGNLSEAEIVYLNLYHRKPQDVAVMEVLYSFYSTTGKGKEAENILGELNKYKRK